MGHPSTRKDAAKRLSLLLFILGALSITSCAHGGAKTIVYEAPEKPFKVLAVFPAKIRYDKTSMVEDVHRTDDLLDALWKHSTWLTITPTQFRVIDEREKAALHGTDLVRTLRQLKFKPQDTAYLRLTLSTREKVGSARIRGKTGVKIGKEVDIKIVAILELYTLDGTLVAESEAITTHDPFGEYPDYDQKPAARDAITNALKGLVEECHDCFEEAFRAKHPTTTSPAIIMHSNTINNESFIDELKKVDPLERDFRLLLAMQYFQPQLTLPQSKILSKSSAGFCLGAAAKEPFTPFDCVTHINSKAINSVHELSQARPDLQELKLRAITPQGKKRTIILPIE